jgi:hypothetical protein
MNDFLIIVADNYRDAMLYAREHDLGPERRRWRFACDIFDVRGMSPCRYVVLTRGELSGSALRDRLELEQHLRAFGFQCVEEPS